MNRTIKLLLNIFLTLCVFSLGSGCSGTESATNDWSSATINQKLNCTGDATGTEFSGTYAIETSAMTFTGNCPADVVKESDFCVNMALSEEEIAEIIETGYPASSGALEVEQNEGVLIFKGVGDDDSDITGCINANGNFVVTYSYAYEDEDNYYVSTHQGNITGTHISTQYQSTLKFPPIIDCTFQYAYEGDK